MTTKRVHLARPATRLAKVATRVCDGKRFDLRENPEPANLTLDIAEVTCRRCQHDAVKIDRVFEAARRLLVAEGMA